MAVAPLAETGLQVEKAEQKEAARVAYEGRLLYLLRWSDHVMGQVEELNLDDWETVTPDLGRAVARLEAELGMLPTPAYPASTHEALERLYEIQGLLFRLRQPWYWSNRPPHDGDDDDS